MTKLEKPVRRVTGSGRDRYVVTLVSDEHGDWVEVRELHRRQSYRIGVGALYTKLVLVDTVRNGRKR